MRYRYLIVQSPGYVTILHEEYRDRRIIPVDGRRHGGVRQWLGDAVGRWEGNTLVVDTTNFLDRTNYGSRKGNGRDVTFADGRRLFLGSSGTGAPVDGRDPADRRR
jgi:hypothetical protein